MVHKFYGKLDFHKIKFQKSNRLLNIIKFKKSNRLLNIFTNSEITK